MRSSGKEVTVSDIPWLEAARADLGVTEKPGQAVEDRVMRMYAAIGHPEVEDDAVAWCAAATGSWLVKAKLPIPPPNVNMLARSYLTYGVPCEPKPGAIAIWPRGKSWQGHVNIIDRITPDGKLICIGGNQGAKGAVTETAPMDPNKALGFRWPVAATVPDLRKAGSTEVKKGDRVQNLGILATFLAPVIAAVKELFDGIPSIPHFASIPEGLTFWQQTIEGGSAVGRVFLANPWLAGAIIGGLVLATVGHSIKAARVAKAEAGMPLSSAVGA